MFQKIHGNVKERENLKSVLDHQESLLIHGQAKFGNPARCHGAGAPQHLTVVQRATTVKHDGTRSETDRTRDPIG